MSENKSKSPTQTVVWESAEQEPIQAPTTEDISSHTTILKLDVETSFLEMMARRRGYTTIEEYVTALIDQDDEAMWDEQFASSQEVIVEKAKAALAEHEAGLTEELDADNNTDTQ